MRWKAAAGAVDAPDPETRDACGAPRASAACFRAEAARDSRARSCRCMDCGSRSFCGCGLGVAETACAAAPGKVLPSMSTAALRASPCSFCRSSSMRLGAFQHLWFRNAASVGACLPAGGASTVGGIGWRAAGPLPMLAPQRLCAPVAKPRSAASSSTAPIVPCMAAARSASTAAAVFINRLKPTALLLRERVGLGVSACLANILPAPRCCCGCCSTHPGGRAAAAAASGCCSWCHCVGAHAGSSSLTTSWSSAGPASGRGGSGSSSESSTHAGWPAQPMWRWLMAWVTGQAAAGCSFKLVQALLVRHSDRPHRRVSTQNRLLKSGLCTLGALALSRTRRAGWGGSGPPSRGCRRVRAAPPPPGVAVGNGPGKPAPPPCRCRQPPARPPARRWGCNSFGCRMRCTPAGGSDGFSKRSELGQCAQLRDAMCHECAAASPPAVRTPAAAASCWPQLSHAHRHPSPAGACRPRGVAGPLQFA